MSYLVLCFNFLNHAFVMLNSMEVIYIEYRGQSNVVEDIYRISWTIKCGRRQIVLKSSYLWMMAICLIVLFCKIIKKPRNDFNIFHKTKFTKFEL